MPIVPKTKISVRVIKSGHLLEGRIGVVKEINSLISDKATIVVYFEAEDITATLSIHHIEEV